MQDKSINGALLALRKDIIRGKLDGLEHVEALLTLRGVDTPRVMPPKRSDAARRGVTYGQLVEKLAAIGVDDNERNLRNKVSRGKFTAGFFLQCLSALGSSQLHLD